MARGKHVCPQHCYVEGNNGGSYITLQESNSSGMCYLEVGETCVTTIRKEMSVVQLAAILTWARDIGFDRILREYAGGALADWSEGQAT